MMSQIPKFQKKIMNELLIMEDDSFDSTSKLEETEDSLSSDDLDPITKVKEKKPFLDYEILKSIHTLMEHEVNNGGNVASYKSSVKTLLVQLMGKLEENFQTNLKLEEQISRLKQNAVSRGVDISLSLLFFCLRFEKKLNMRQIYKTSEISCTKASNLTKSSNCSESWNLSKLFLTIKPS
jgi:predicted RND superfamily exporter protein